MRGVMAGLTVRGLPGEILAGLTLLALSVPLNIGYAQIAGESSRRAQSCKLRTADGHFVTSESPIRP